MSSKGISMEVEKIKVVKKWPEPKLVQDIQVFLGFANFYQQFIQGFSRIAALLTSMPKTAVSPERLTLEEIGHSEGGDGVGSIEIAKKSRKSKGHKMSKSQKSAKSQKLSMPRKSKGEKLKKPSKSGNSPNFDVKNSGPSFLTPKARSAFNRLWLAFTKALILWHFDPKYHIQIKTDALGYAIGDMLSQLASGTSPNRVIIKANLS